MSFDYFDAQARNPQPYGTYRDSPGDKSKRAEKWGAVGCGINSNRKGKPDAARSARKKQQYERNRAARSALYASNDGSISAASVPAWHSALTALSNGTHG